MIQFDLNWYSAAVLVSPIATGQRPSYRQKSVGGAWISTGFIPSGVLPKYVQTVKSPMLAENKVWEFKIDCLCGEVATPNDNGNQEALVFACIEPTVTKTTNSSTAVLGVSGLDITKATFTLHKTSDGAIVYGPITVNKSGTGISATATGLEGNTQYYWETQLHATVNGQEIVSGSCNSQNFSTELASCEPITNITATATEF